MKNINPTNTQAWKALETHQSQLAHTTIADLFKQEENRFNDYSLTFENQILVDFSKNKINQHKFIFLKNDLPAISWDYQRCIFECCKMPGRFE